MELIGIIYPTMKISRTEQEKLELMEHKIQALKQPDFLPDECESINVLSKEITLKDNYLKKKILSANLEYEICDFNKPHFIAYKYEIQISSYVDLLMTLIKDFYKFDVPCSAFNQIPFDHMLEIVKNMEMESQDIPHNLQDQLGESFALFKDEFQKYILGTEKKLCWEFSEERPYEVFFNLQIQKT